MKVENLYEGQVLKNYKELCNALEIDVKAGKQKKIQINEIERYFEMFRIGNSYKIMKVRREPLPKTSERGKASKINNSKYIKDIENILIYAMNNQEQSRLSISKNKALEMVYMVNDRYNIGKQNIGREAELLGLDEIYLNDFFLNNHSQLTTTFERSLRAMKNKGLLIWETRYYVYDNNKYRLATNKEKQLIVDYQEVYLKANDCETLFQAYARGVLRKMNKVICESINEEIGTGIKFFYEGYEINISKKGIEREVKKSEFITSINELNKNIAKKVLVSTESRMNNAKSKPRFGEDKIDMTNKYNKIKVKDDYVDIHSKLIDMYIVN